ncbi:RNA polymerase sigma factor [Dictyobacter arantiisoli]|uniref:RNA polymerase sigma-70 factor n=1 Tax=Dictyobacter arantiisoli TaxID=2014874 RepID=A0A5A5THR6_9CHLR|nr:RNA polymerase sigma factor [Dictyobacter arantiisoli]GCF10514.1 RNA polymerase sigma-70 factor [Dictyobacter arantiisoli]
MYPHLPDDISVEWLVREARAGNQQAADRLFYLFYRKICHFFLRDLHVSVEMAEELVQDTFEKAWRKLPTLQNCLVFESWLYTIARNVGFDHVRKLKRRKDPTPLDPEFDLADSSPPVESLVLAEMHIREMWNAMPPRQRECLYLFYMENLTMLEISARLQLGADTVKVYISKARMTLRDGLYASEEDVNDVKSKRCRA